MTTTFIDTNKLPRVETPEGEVAEILNGQARRGEECGGRAALARFRREAFTPSHPASTS